MDATAVLIFGKELSDIEKVAGNFSELLISKNDMKLADG